MTCIEGIHYMAPKSRKKKPVTLPGRNSAIELAEDKVLDPYDGKPLDVVRNTRVHPLDYLKAHGRITFEQKAAGDAFLAIYDKAEIGGARAIDYERVKVDVSFVHRGIPAGTAEAIQNLAAIRLAVGPRPYKILLMVIGERQMPSEIAERNWCSHNAISQILKWALDDLIDFLGAAQGRRRSRPKDKYDEVAAKPR
jgi:hypothetical protein